MILNISNKAPWLMSLMAGAMLCSCTNEAPVIPDNATGGVEANNIVRLRLDGLTGKGTRADGDQTMEALDREKTINKLYAVAFADGAQTLPDGTSISEGAFYKVYKVTLPGQTEEASGDANYLPNDNDSEDNLPQFRLDTTGKFRFFFVANPGDRIEAALTDGTTLLPGTSTKDDLMRLETDNSDGYEAQRTGICSVDLSDFLMFSYDPAGYPLENKNGDDQTLDIKMQRAAARFDIVNMAEDYRITNVLFASLPSATTLGLLSEPLPTASLGLSGFGTAGTEDWSDLIGSTTDPGYFSSRVYSYEYLTENGGYADKFTRPLITITYCPVDNASDERTVKINFKEPQTYPENKSAGASVTYSGFDNEGNAINYDTTLTEDVKKGDYMIVDYGDSKKGILYSDQDIPIQRNHLYRVRLTKLENVNETLVLPILEVIDWNEAEILRPNGNLEFDKNVNPDQPEDPSQEPLTLQEIRSSFLGFEPNYMSSVYYDEGKIWCRLGSSMNPFQKTNSNIERFATYDESGNVVEAKPFYLAENPELTYRYISENEACFLFPFEGGSGGSVKSSEDLNIFGYDITNSTINKLYSSGLVLMERFSGTPLHSYWSYYELGTGQGLVINVLPAESYDGSEPMDKDIFESLLNDNPDKFLDFSVIFNRNEITQSATPKALPVVEIGKPIKWLDYTGAEVNADSFEYYFPLMVRIF